MAPAVRGARSLIHRRDAEFAEKAKQKHREHRASREDTERLAIFLSATTFGGNSSKMLFRAACADVGY